MFVRHTNLLRYQLSCKGIKTEHLQWIYSNEFRLVKTNVAENFHMVLMYTEHITNVFVKEWINTFAGYHKTLLSAADGRTFVWSSYAAHHNFMSKMTFHSTAKDKQWRARQIKSSTDNINSLCPNECTMCNQSLPMCMKKFIVCYFICYILSEHNKKVGKIF